MKMIDLKTHFLARNKRYLVLILILTALIITFIVIIPAASVSFTKQNQTWSNSFLHATRGIQIKDTDLKVAIAKSDAEIIQGLSNRSKLGDNEGMLFIFTDTNHRTFWMKDMLFNIDMIFINNNQIVDIAKNMPKPKPWDWPATYESKAPADMVLEVNAGLSDEYGWEVGDTISINK